jgi:hypothetical protein
MSRHIIKGSCNLVVVSAFVALRPQIYYRSTHLGLVQELKSLECRSVNPGNGAKTRKSEQSRLGKQRFFSLASIRAAITRRGDACLAGSVSQVPHRSGAIPSLHLRGNQGA